MAELIAADDVVKTLEELAAWVALAQNKYEAKAEAEPILADYHKGRANGMELVALHLSHMLADANQRRDRAAENCHIDLEAE